MLADPRRDIGIMRQEIGQLPALIRTQLQKSRQTVSSLLDSLDVQAIPRVVLTGCGDSYFVGLAARWVFERYAGVHAEAIPALDLARYYVDSLPKGTLVLPISYSGLVARTVEAARNADQVGATVVAITGRPERRLAQTAPRHLAVQIPSLGFSPGTTTYIGLLLATYVLAIELGVRRGTLQAGQAKALLAQLQAGADVVERAIVENDTVFEVQAQWLAEADTVVFLGAGPNWASALFGAAKLFEGAQMHGVAQNIEEWAHEQYFISGKQTRTVLLAPAGRALDRAQEIATEMRFIETPFLAITDDPDSAGWRSLTPRLAMLPGGVPELFSPLLFAVPLSLLGYYLAVARGKTSYNFPSEAHEREHYETLHNSHFRDMAIVETAE